jgi:hypothetical protein
MMAKTKPKTKTETWVFHVALNYVGCEEMEEFEYPVGTTEEDIQTDFEDWVWNQLDSGFWKKEGEAT